MSSHIRKNLMINAREDRISKLPDELIHHILLFLDAGLAVRMSILSKRWKFIWTTLPFLCFDEHKHLDRRVFAKFLDHVFDHRNHDRNISTLKLQFRRRGACFNGLKDYVKYTIDRDVQEVHVEKYSVDSSIFESETLKKLYLAAHFDWSFTSSDEFWYLPALTTLHLKQLDSQAKLPASCLICLPALTDLCLEGFNLEIISSLPGLRKLQLKSCELPQPMWDLPALQSLELDKVEIDKNLSEFLSTLVNLQHLKLLSCFWYTEDCFICCPQLLNLELSTTDTEDDVMATSNIMISAPKLVNVNAFGIFLITCCDSKLENVHVKLHGYFVDKNSIQWGWLKQCYRQLMFMFRGLGSTKILTLDSDTIEALSVIVDHLECSPFPFHNLKYVKLPRGYKESSICGTVRNYLLGGSPGATIVTTMNDVIPQNATVSLAPSETLNPTIDRVNSHGIHKKVFTPVVVEEKVGRICAPGFGGLLPDAPGSISNGNNDVGLWQGYEVNSEFVGLLDHIMKNYPQTFEQFTAENKKLCTMKLNMLCTAIIAFTTTNMTETNTKLITEYRTVFSDLQRSFNVKWLVSHLNYIEQFLFSQQELHAINSCISNARRESQVLATGCAQKTKVEEALITSGTNPNVGVGYIGDDLLQDLTTKDAKG